jgi:hypothetical protein
MFKPSRLFRRRKKVSIPVITSWLEAENAISVIEATAITFDNEEIFRARFMAVWNENLMTSGLFPHVLPIVDRQVPPIPLLVVDAPNNFVINAFLVLCKKIVTFIDDYSDIISLVGAAFKIALKIFNLIYE